MKSNYVTGGTYSGKPLVAMSGKARIVKGIRESVFLDHENVAYFQTLSFEAETSKASAVKRGAFGAVLFGPVGLLGAAMAKKVKAYRLLVVFKDGHRSTIVTDKRIFECISKHCQEEG